MLSEKKFKVSLVLLMLGICIPATINFNFGSLLFTPLRFVSFYLLFFALPYVIGSWKGNRKIVLLDLIIILHTLWPYVAMMKNHGVATGIEAGGLYTVDFLPFYMFGRLVGQSPQFIRLFAKAIFYAASFLLPFALIEAIWGVNLIKTALGQPTDFFEKRMGLNRTYSSFSHPILFGLFASSLTGIVWFSLKGRQRLGGLFVLFMCVFTALSSAPMISLFSQTALIIWGAMFRRYKNKWKAAVYLALAMVAAIEVFSPSGVVRWVISHMTFNPQTGYYRLAIWEFGSMEVERHPLFGIGYNDWVRPAWMVVDSVDNFWLFTSMKYGLPSILTLILVLLISIYRVVKLNNPDWKEFKQGWLISVFGFVLVGTTVHFWSSAFSFFAIIIGLGVTLGSGKHSSVISQRSQPLNRMSPRMS